VHCRIKRNKWIPQFKNVAALIAATWVWAKNEKLAEF